MTASRNLSFGDYPVDRLNGIGASSASRLEKLGIAKIQDLLFHLPLRYEDRTILRPLGGLQSGHTALVVGRVELSDIVLSGRRSLVCRIADGTGSLDLRFFYFSQHQAQQFKPGIQLCCFGEVRSGYLGLEMIHPEYQVVTSTENLTEPTLTPVYPLTDGIRQATLRKAVQQALHDCLHEVSDWLPAEIIERHGFLSLVQTLKVLHAPEPPLEGDINAVAEARKRLAFEELLAHHLCLARIKQENRRFRAPAFTVSAAAKSRFLAELSFSLTAAQHRVIEEIEADLSACRPMQRLVQGDVGSGKTIVAACSALPALLGDHQVALMAPTELLAEQHYRNFSVWLQSFDIKVYLFTGKAKGKLRRQYLLDIANGSANMVIGTHALFQEQVRFAKLGLVIIDEQHRFGVDQRLALLDKCLGDGYRPHQLVMTATPIPRTLAMLHYADLDISAIDELPPGRKTVVTRVMSSSRRDEVIDRIRRWVARKRQVYWVCPLIEQSEKLQCEAAEETAAFLTEALPELNIGLVHGRLKSVEKDKVMQAFKNHSYDVLVATTVIEVGVDVPNASLMVIENADRLGLSQLHQLRGRVGRGQADSYCLLLYQAPLSEAGKQRLGILRETEDGFKIAQQDLELRGPGEFMGTRQTGPLQFKIASLEQDADLIDFVLEAADVINRDYPQSVEFIIQRWLTGSNQYTDV